MGRGGGGGEDDGASADGGRKHSLQCIKPVRDFHNKETRVSAVVVVCE